MELGGVGALVALGGGGDGDDLGGRRGVGQAGEVLGVVVRREVRVDHRQNEYLAFPMPPWKNIRSPRQSASVDERQGSAFPGATWPSPARS